MLSSSLKNSNSFSDVKDKVPVEVVVASDLESLNYDRKEEDEIFAAEDNLSSSLSARQLSMITLVMVFGTGLFLSSGGTLATAGPVGMLLGYVIVGIVVLFNQMAICEVSCLMPVTSGYVKHSTFFADEALGFSMGWLDVYSNLIPNELSATAVVMTYWTDLNPGIFIACFGVFIVAVNCYNIRWYGEIEFFFGCLKILLVTGLILTGIIIDLGGVPGQERLGFHYWKQGAFNEKYTTGSLGQFAAFWKAISSIVYAFGGVQAICLLSGEVKYPRRATYRAATRVFTRVFIMYFTTVFILTLIVSSKDPAIASPTGNAAGSPFVVAMKSAGIKVLPHIINGVVLTSALSAANLQVLKSSRTIYALASKRQAPLIFLRVNKKGLPYVAVAFSCMFIPLAFMSVNSASSTVFSWFQSLTSSNILVNWCLISANHIFMSRAMRAQGYTRDQLPYKFKLGEFGAWFSLFFSALFLLTGGFANFIKGNFVFSSFFTSYFVIPLSIVLYLFWKFFKKTKFLKPEEVNLKALFRHVENNPEPEYPKLRGWRILTLLWA